MKGTKGRTGGVGIVGARVVKKARGSDTRCIRGGVMGMTWGIVPRMIVMKINCTSKIASWE